MSDELTLARFRAMAEAYGGTIARWPAEARTAAAAMATQPEARDILVEAEALDTTLEAWGVPILRQATLRAAIHGIPVRRGLGRARLWWSGLGIAAAIAGAATGSIAAAAMAHDETSSDGASAFGDPGGLEG